MNSDFFSRFRTGGHNRVNLGLKDEENWTSSSENMLILVDPVKNRVNNS